MTENEKRETLLLLKNELHQSFNSMIQSSSGIQNQINQMFELARSTFLDQEKSLSDIRDMKNKIAHLQSEIEIQSKTSEQELNKTQSKHRLEKEMLLRECQIQIEEMSKLSAITQERDQAELRKLNYQVIYYQKEYQEKSKLSEQELTQTISQHGVEKDLVNKKWKSVFEQLHLDKLNLQKQIEHLKAIPEARNAQLLHDHAEEMSELTQRVEMLKEKTHRLEIEHQDAKELNQKLKILTESANNAISNEVKGRNLIENLTQELAALKASHATIEEALTSSTRDNDRLKKLSSQTEKTLNEEQSENRMRFVQLSKLLNRYIVENRMESVYPEIEALVEIKTKLADWSKVFKPNTANPSSTKSRDVEV